MKAVIHNSVLCYNIIIVQHKDTIIKHEDTNIEEQHNNRFTLIAKRGPLTISTPLRTQTQVDTVNTYMANIYYN